MAENRLEFKTSRKPLLRGSIEGCHKFRVYRFLLYYDELKPLTFLSDVCIVNIFYTMHMEIPSTAEKISASDRLYSSRFPPTKSDIFAQN